MARQTEIKLRPMPNRGDVYAQKHDYNRAIADYNEAIRLDPQNARTYAARGLADIMKRDYDRAIADFSEAIRLGPKNARAYATRGHAYNMKGDHDSALAISMKPSASIRLIGAVIALPAI